MSKRYKVVGVQPIHGTPPGGTFEADLPEAEEDFLKGIGAIQAVGGRPAKDESPAVEAAAEELAEEQEAEKRAPDVES